MPIFKRKVPNHFIPINSNNVTTKDWLILLEAGTIIGASPRKLRVARSTQERTVVKKHNLLLQAEYYLDVEGYDPRIHAVFFCPQLFKYDSEKRLVPLHGEEIGKLIARTLESGINERRPWYLPSDDLPTEPVIDLSTAPEFDTLVVDMPHTESLEHNETRPRSSHLIHGYQDGGAAATAGTTNLSPAKGNGLPQ